MNRCIIYIMGVSGSGKTTIGKKLAERTGLPFFDGDDFHSATNKEKMKAGQPLTDDDRMGWLIRLNELAKEQMNKGGAVVACSALKKKYRDILSQGITEPVYWILLQGTFDQIRKRMEERKGHYMAPGMLSSQFEILEIPGDCITVDISKSPEVIVAEVMRELEQRSQS